MQLRDRINSAKGTKQLQKNEINIECKTGCLSKLKNSKQGQMMLLFGLIYTRYFKQFSVIKNGTIRLF